MLCALGLEGFSQSGKNILGRHGDKGKSERWQEGHPSGAVLHNGRAEEEERGCDWGRTGRPWQALAGSGNRHIILL